MSSTIRKPPRMQNDRLHTFYDFSPRHGWGLYPIRDERGGNHLVWEEDDRAGNSHPMLSRLHTDSLANLVTVGKSLGMPTS